ncbi:MAG: hypothetical protein R2873_08895 [Caldilineaceae bacterium]
MKRYLLYDGGCSKCSHVATTVRDAVGDSLDLLSLRTDEAKDLLDTAHPKGWRYAPYVVTVDDKGVHAKTGILASMQLGLWMGPRKAMRVWQAVTQAFAPKRRSFLQTSVASALAILMLARTHGETQAAPNGCGSCQNYSKCIQYVYSGCACGTCCSSTFAYDRYTYYRVNQQPTYPGQSCYGCSYCWNMIIHRPCGCPRRY